jgi:hypothetical protein
MFNLEDGGKTSTIKAGKGTVLSIILSKRNSDLASVHTAES